MAIHVVVGAGPVGTSIAKELIERGETVRVITRSGTGPAGAEKLAADASDATTLAQLCTGAAVIYNCVNPPYDKWPTLWPPLAAAFLHAAEVNNSVLAIVDNLYAYGPVDGPMSPQTPDRPSSVKGEIRRKMWTDALAAAASGRIKAVVAVRGADYVGDGPSLVSMLVLPSVKKGKAALVPADLDAPHTWTNPADAGRLLVKAAQEQQAWNQYWLVPSAPAISIRELSVQVCAAAGLPEPKLRKMPGIVLKVGGLFNPVAKEFVEMNYQFQRPFLLDTSRTAELFGPVYTPLAQSIQQNVVGA